MGIKRLKASLKEFRDVRPFSCVTAISCQPSAGLVIMFILKGEHMPKFITIGYGDKAGYDRTEPHIRDAAHAHDDMLKKRGALIGIAGAPVQVWNPDATGVQTKNAAFMSSALPIAGFAVIEAADLSEAIKLVSQTPCAVAHGVVEVWPLQEP
jgi:hypothetical protein